MQKNILSSTIFHFLLIAVLSLIAYSNTFKSSFQFDDHFVIVKNPIIKDLRYFTEPSSARDFKGPFEYKTFKQRYIAYLTFALNYRIHGLKVAGYHYVNLLVHICTSLLLYFLIMLTFQTPYLRDSAIRDYAKHIAFFTALLFACHPLQTQAVTYIWQRVTLLSTMLYLLSLVTYIKGRLLSQSVEVNAEGAKIIQNKHIYSASGPAILYLLSLAFNILAMKTKEIAFMLPIMMTVYELIFFKGNVKKRVLFLIPFFITMLIIPLTLMRIDRPIGELIGDIDDNIRGNTPILRREYLITEFRVLMTYLRLIFVPINQNLDYDYPAYDSFFNINVFLSFSLLAIIFGFSVYLLFRYKNSIPHIRLIFLGIIWFFINLLLESSIIPLYNVIFEHRMYLPSIGLFLTLSVAIFMIMNRWKAYARAITAMLAFVIIVLTGVSYARNAVWKDEMTLWQDVVKKSPHKAVAHYNLANVYDMQGLYGSAITHYQKAITFNSAYSDAYNNLGNIYASQGLTDKAVEQYLTAIKVDRHHPQAHFNLGNAYASQGRIDEAIKHYQTAINIDRSYADAYYNLGNAYGSIGFIDKAIDQLIVAVELKPDAYPDAHYNLGVAYYNRGRMDEAIKHYLLSIQLKPDYPEAHYKLGLAYKSRGDINLAIKEYNNALRLKPGWDIPLRELEQINKEL